MGEASLEERKVSALERIALRLGFILFMLSMIAGSLLALSLHR